MAAHQMQHVVHRLPWLLMSCSDINTIRILSCHYKLVHHAIIMIAITISCCTLSLKNSLIDQVKGHPIHIYIYIYYVYIYTYIYIYICVTRSVHFRSQNLLKCCLVTFRSHAKSTVNDNLTSTWTEICFMPSQASLKEAQHSLQNDSSGHE